MNIILYLTSGTNLLCYVHEWTVLVLHLYIPNIPFLKIQATHQEKTITLIASAQNLSHLDLISFSIDPITGS
jgi:hypothetical protein